jgi:hypothetical protein
MKQLSARVWSLPILKHNSADAFELTLQLARSDLTNTVLALELTPSEALFIKSRFPKSEFYPLLDLENYQCVDMSLVESARLAYASNAAHEFFFDKLFVQLLNR